jgi:hypothetical protein
MVYPIEFRGSHGPVRHVVFAHKLPAGRAAQVDVVFQDPGSINNASDRDRLAA